MPRPSDSSNLLVRYAITNNRDYITPEDITHALENHAHTTDETVVDFLEILGKRTEMSIEDAGLCGFLLWNEMK